MSMSRRGIVLLSLFICASCAQADVYVANQNSNPPSVTVYGASSVDNAAPVRTIAGALTGFVSPSAVTLDTVNNELYVADFFGQAVRVFSAGATGDVAPVRTLIHGINSQIGQVRMVAVDLFHDELIVVSSNVINVFPRTASGDAIRLRTISGTATKLKDPLTIVYDALHNTYITNSYDVAGPNLPGILTFDRNASGNVAPLRAISGAATQLGTFTNSTALDNVNDEIWSQGDDGPGIVAFPRTATGDVAPTRNITGPATGLAGVGGILVEGSAANRVTVVDRDLNRIAVFKRTATGNAAPLLAIAGPATGLGTPTTLAVDAFGGFSTPPKVTLDIDRDNSYDALTDGMLIVRHLSGLTSNALLAGALGANATRFMAADITQYLDGIQPALNVDGDLLSESPTDGLLVLRYLLGLRGTALTTGALGAAATWSPAQIETYIQSLMP